MTCTDDCFYSPFLDSIISIHSNKGSWLRQVIMVEQRLYLELEKETCLCLMWALFNSLAPEGCGYDFKWVNVKHKLDIDILSIQVKYTLE